MISGIHHEYSALTREHRFIIDAAAIERIGYKVEAASIPSELEDTLGDMVNATKFKYRIEADRRRLKHFRKLYGPGFSKHSLPKGNFA